MKVGYNRLTSAEGILMKPFRLCLSLFASAVLYAGTVTHESSDASLVVYNAGIGLLHDTRTITLDAGKQTVLFPDVADSIVADSVHARFPDGARLYTQRYRFDPIKLSALLKAHIGKDVKIRTRENDEGYAIKAATLLSSDGRQCIVKSSDGDIFPVPADHNIFDSLPDTMFATPTLLWEIDAAHAISGTFSVGYLMDKISWKSHYILKLHDNSADLAGLATVDNRSGKRFEKIRLALLAGKIGRAEKPPRYLPYQTMKAAAAEQAASISPAALHGYYHYPVPFPVTIAENETVQIKFLDERSHPFTRKYETNLNNPLYLGSDIRHDVARYLLFDGFDTPLPAGVVRTYASHKDSGVLLGETVIPHTPKHEKLALLIGVDFDTVVREKLKERNDDKNFFDVTVAYEVSNRGEAAKEVALLVPFTRRGTQQSSVTSKEPYSWKDGNTLLFRVTVKADSKRRFEVRYRSKR
jgi:hypothetical protein